MLLEYINFEKILNGEYLLHIFKKYYAKKHLHYSLPKKRRIAKESPKLMFIKIERKNTDEKISALKLIISQHDQFTFFKFSTRKLVAF